MRTTHHVTVTARTQLTPRMVRLTLAGPSLLGLVTTPAQDISLILDAEDGRRVKRRYTIRSSRPILGELDIDALIHHGDGPGSRWARRAPLGSSVRFTGPRGKLELRPADWHLFVGDEAALPAIAALTDALGSSATHIVVAEIASTADQLPLRATVLRWISRDHTPPGTASLLADALDALHTPPGVGRGYVLGESRVVTALREKLPLHGISPDRAYVKGYWNVDQPERVRASDQTTARGESSAD